MTDGRPLREDDGSIKYFSLILKFTRKTLDLKDRRLNFIVTPPQLARYDKSDTGHFS